MLVKVALSTSNGRSISHLHIHLFLAWQRTLICIANCSTGRFTPDLGLASVGHVLDPLSWFTTGLLPPQRRGIMCNNVHEIRPFGSATKTNHRSFPYGDNNLGFARRFISLSSAMTKITIQRLHDISFANAEVAWQNCKPRCF